MLVSREPIGCNSREFPLFVLVVFLCAVSVVCDSEACVCSVYTVRRVFECGRCSFLLDIVVVCGE